MLVLFILAFVVEDNFLRSVSWGALPEPTTSRRVSSRTTREDTKGSKIFIGIKTSLDANMYGERLSQIAKTWLVDALDTERIHIKLFVDAEPLPSSMLVQTFDYNSGMLDIAPHLVQTSPSPPNAQHLAWKTSRLFSYFFDHYNSTTSSRAEKWWFCSFDDDNYVLIDNLLEVIDSLQNHTNVYAGRPSLPDGLTINRPLPDGLPVGRKIKFLTGGAGYCISPDLVQRGGKYFVNLTAEDLHDDVAVGRIVSERLNVTQMFHPKFHSHLENQLRTILPVDEIAKQVSFGHDNKRKNGKHDAFPNVPILFPPEEDPLLFQSLRCFLLLQHGNGNVPSKCQNASITDATYS